MGVKKQKASAWGFDLNNIDPKVRPQDDFYRYANGGWIKRNSIPPEESRWGSFNILRFNTEEQLHVLVLDILGNNSSRRSGGSHKAGSHEQLIADTYRSALDQKRRNALGMKPLLPTLEQIRSVSTFSEFVSVMTTMHRIGVSVPWEFYLDQDSKNSSRYLLHLTQDGIGMPEREYYLSDAPEHTRVRDAYIIHIEKILKLARYSPAKAKEAREVVMRIETKLAQFSMKKEDARDTEKTYNKYTVAKLQKESPEIDWKRYFKGLGAGELKEVNVGQPEFFKKVTKLLAALPLQEWKQYLEWHAINEHAGLLSEPFVKENWDFYSKTLTGAKQMRAPWRRALGAVNGMVGEALGKKYVEKHFTREAKRRMDALVDDLFAAYEIRIKKLDWMSPKTKKQAIAKLHAMNRKIGYPKKFETYKGLIIRPDDFFGNALRASEFYHKKAMRRLNRPVDRNEWLMSPQTVNAYHHFNLNEIVFPAAILQPPFFFAQGDDAVNYGAIGSVIGHEISHGFDDQGSKFNAKGNMLPWWTPQDRKRFEKKADVLVKQFNAYKVADGVSVNGKLTLGENIADLAGLAIAFDALQIRLKKTGRKVIDGFTPEQRYFLGYAQSEQTIARPEIEKMLAMVDPHSASEHRVNGPASDLEPFYAAFNVQKGDALYRDPSKRAKIW